MWPSKTNKYKDIDCVSIKVPVTANSSSHGEKTYPAGTIGTIIDSYDREYLVEFPGDPAEDGMIYQWFEALVKEQDLDIYKEYQPA